MTRRKRGKGWCLPECTQPSSRGPRVFRSASCSQFYWSQGLAHLRPSLCPGELGSASVDLQTQVSPRNDWVSSSPSLPLSSLFSRGLGSCERETGSRRYIPVPAVVGAGAWVSHCAGHQSKDRFLDSLSFLTELLHEVEKHFIIIKSAVKSD